MVTITLYNSPTLTTSVEVPSGVPYLSYLPTGGSDFIGWGIPWYGGASTRCNEWVTSTSTTTSDMDLYGFYDYTYTYCPCCHIEMVSGACPQGCTDELDTSTALGTSATSNRCTAHSGTYTQTGAVIGGVEYPTCSDCGFSTQIIYYDEMVHSSDSSKNFVRYSCMVANPPSGAIPGSIPGCKRNATIFPDAPYPTSFMLKFASEGSGGA